MSTHNIPLSILKNKITHNYPKYAAMGFFLETQEQVRNNSGKRAISVRPIEVLLYYFFSDVGSVSGFRQVFRLSVYATICWQVRHHLP